MLFMKKFLLFLLVLLSAPQLRAMDGDLGRDPRFAFQDRVMELIEAQDVQGLESYLHNNPGKSIGFNHYRTHQSPLKIILLARVLASNFSLTQEYENQLFVKIENGTDEALSEFLNNHRGYDLDLFHLGYEKTPLEYAVALGRLGKVKILKNAGAKLDQGVHRNPLLAIALKNLDMPIIKYLAQFNTYDNLSVDGIDINFRNSEHFWPLSNSEFQSTRDTRQALYRLFDQRVYKKCSPQDELSKAATFGRTELLRRALEKGAKVNDYDSKDDTALNQGCSKARISSISYLLEKGADPNLQDQLKGRSALHWVMRMHKKAAQKGARYMSSSELLPCSFLLMAAGADPSVKDASGKSVFYRVRKLEVSKEEKTLIRCILNMQQVSKEERCNLLKDIYEFQVQELQNYIARENIPVPVSAGARYFWHRPECIRMKNAWVRKDKPIDAPDSPELPEYKDIYQKYI